MLGLQSSRNSMTFEPDKSVLIFFCVGANMNLKVLVFGIVIASILLAEQAQAQTRGNQLRGINQMRLVVDPPVTYGRECQITETLVRDAFMFPASGARFVVKDTPR